MGVATSLRDGKVPTPELKLPVSGTRLYTADLYLACIASYNGLRGRYCMRIVLWRCTLSRNS
jgi:hypothetical protein